MEKNSKNQEKFSTPEEFNAGIYAKNLTTHQTIYEQNIERYYSPASNLKLFIAAAGLLQLGPDFSYQTSLSLDKTKIKNHTLHGDIILKFSGDPLFTQDDLANLLKHLQTLGIKTITGNIVINHTAFDENPYADGWAHDQLHICYAGPINTINIDRNCFHFYLFPTKINSVTEIPEAYKLPCKIKNHSITQDNKNLPLSINYDQSDHQFILSGNLASHSRPQHFEVSIPNSLNYLSTLIKRNLNELNIQFLGKINENYHNAISNDNLIQFTHNSQKLSKLIRIMLKYSDNLIANSLFKTLGEYYYHTQGSWTTGINAEKEILEKNIGLDPEKLFIYDGSGMSYYDFVTPEQTIKLLEYIYKNKLLNKYIIPALPTGHTDGTLAKRFPSLKSEVHAKTGSRRDVSALSGYINHCNQTIAFSFYLNNANIEDTAPNTIIIDELIKKIEQNLIHCDKKVKH